ncbi:MAG TPA: 1-phosphofructokinase [Ornithinibacter sp.]|nr:1-phosphofructokinase [Ornithinibacter sp.]
MIVTLTPNPSIDRTIAVDDLRRGEVHRATSSRIDPGGKGINVSRALAAQGVPTLAVLPTGGPEGAVMGTLLDAAGVGHHDVPVAGTLRSNVTVVEPDGTTTKLNEPGPTLSRAEVDALVAATLGATGGDGVAWVVASGSLPPGAPDDLYAVLVATASAQGARVAIDSSGAPMRLAVAARPDLVKPNHEELAELVGHELHTLGDVLDASSDLVAAGIGTVVVSLGGDGAVLVDADSAVHVRTRIPRKLSTVGAGDCTLAGTVAALASGASGEDALLSGCLWGSAAVTLPGSRVPTPEDLTGIPTELFRDPDRSLVISG